jgi:hypothetical protein
MGYDLKPNNEEAGWFHFGAFSWPVLLEQFGCLFQQVNYMSKFYVVNAGDKRFETGAMLTSNDAFPVTAEEAAIMARMTRNYVAIQRSLPEQPDMDPLGPIALQPWPRKIRSDFVDRFEAFAEWAEKSNGFEIR